MSYGIIPADSVAFAEKVCDFTFADSRQCLKLSGTAKTLRLPRVLRHRDHARAITVRVSSETVMGLLKKIDGLPPERSKAVRVLRSRMKAG